MRQKSVDVKFWGWGWKYETVMRGKQGSTHGPSPTLRGGGWIDGDWIGGYEKESYVPSVILGSNTEANSMFGRPYRIVDYLLLADLV